MSRVAIIGCGIVGAACAYELSRVGGLTITVLDQQLPAQGSTGAALGVLMGAISKKVKGRAWQLRQGSMQRYETLIPELEAMIGYQIPCNRQGILMLRFPGEDIASWQELATIRESQGWHLEIWDAQQVQSRCPQVSNEQVIGAIYSPQDRQVDPTALTQALVAAAQKNGVVFNFGVSLEGVEFVASDEPNLRTCRHIHTNTGTLEIDWLVIAAGVGSSGLVNFLSSPDLESFPVIIIKPVLGQALQLRLECPIGHPDFQPVITGDDVHIVPVGEGDYWVGATVEFPDEYGEVVAEPELLERVRQKAIAFCPALAQATIVRTWSGKRPRPEGRPAPVIGKLPGYSNVLLATGHYRNGVFLAPATALQIREAIVQV
ncbi:MULTISPECIES: NAD(P)/FAD-dependent oxidoreductase [unclassified Coleofasciculus]|uniref:NAD(P)/FAD-dependent oxidoreductase n=1 Tax=unclassified Coleofasciculus TaxID=2692782 RepID=UPI001881DBF4|nr:MULTISPECIES: FAD-dependent oxidoreductase [unclassified Coleofasciculus]MBE9129795.1 FAD-binding oxidoreductase [Coleofasciculus sp. LEGE 07081]MBE9152256.1 FAD-binding oxidoreductase [Coleofasciculus sp. LEGE 07092]